MGITSGYWCSDVQKSHAVMLDYTPLLDVGKKTIHGSDTDPIIASEPANKNIIFTI
jgi:hypothetical protein